MIRYFDPSDHLIFYVIFCSLNIKNKKIKIFQTSQIRKIPKKNLFVTGLVQPPKICSKMGNDSEEEKKTYGLLYIYIVHIYTVYVLPCADEQFVNELSFTWIPGFRLTHLLKPR